MVPIAVGSEGVRQIFEQDVPDAFIDDLLRVLVRETKAAVREVGEKYVPEVAHDLLPHLRRSKLEHALAQLPQRHGGMASQMPNKAENSHHIEIIFNRVLVTQHFVREIGEVPRPAAFRDNLVEQAQEVFFFMRRGPVEQRPVVGIYAQFLHGPIDRRTSFPSFARISFPAGEGEEITSIDLTRRLAKLFVSQFQPEQIEDDLTLARKSKPESEEG